MCTSRLLFCAAGSLLLASVTSAAFERALFPQPPLGANPRVTTNPATLAHVGRPCGGVGYDRPFGLQALSGHRLLLAVPLSRGVALGLGGLAGARPGTGSTRRGSVWAHGLSILSRWG